MDNDPGGMGIYLPLLGVWLKDLPVPQGFENGSDYSNYLIGFACKLSDLIYLSHLLMTTVCCKVNSRLRELKRIISSRIIFCLEDTISENLFLRLCLLSLVSESGHLAQDQRTLD